MERVWTSRLRWRLRGAWLAPLLVLLTLADALLIHWRPLAGDGPTGFFAALLLASFLNLVAIAALAPFLGMAWRRLRPELPVVVARDRAGVVLVLLVTAGLVVGGALHHGTVVRNTDALADAHARAIAWIGTYAPAPYRRHLAAGGHGRRRPRQPLPHLRVPTPRAAAPGASSPTPRQRPPRRRHPERRLPGGAGLAPSASASGSGSSDSPPSTAPIPAQTVSAKPMPTSQETSAIAIPIGP